jgi:hypothetical protein
MIYTQFQFLSNGFMTLLHQKDKTSINRYLTMVLKDNLHQRFVVGKRPATVTSFGGAATNSIVPVSVSSFCSQNDNRQYDCTLKYC